MNTFKQISENLRNLRIAEINCIIAKTLSERNEINYDKSDINSILSKIKTAQNNIRTMQIEQSTELKQCTECFFI